MTLPAGLEGKVSIKLRKLVWRQVFDVVLSPIGYDYVERQEGVEVLLKQEVDNLPSEEQREELFFQRPEEMAGYLERKLRPLFEISVEAVKDAVIFRTHPRNAIAYADKPEFRLNPFPRRVYFPEHIPDFSELPTTEFALGNSVDLPFRSTDVFVLEWVNGEVLKRVVAREFAEKAKVQVDVRNNTLVVTASTSVMRDVSKLVAYLDDKRSYSRPETGDSQ